MNKELYSMALHDELSINNVTDVIRVPGGWIYRVITGNDNLGYPVSICFVPYDNGFDTRKFPKGK
jgi:hypothetical protein